MSFTCSSEEQSNMAGLLSQNGSVPEEAASALVAILCNKFSAVGLAVDSTSNTVDAILETEDALGKSLDGSFVLFSTYLVFFMQAGFAMLCAGSVRSKNCTNVLLKNVLDACFGAPMFFFVGWGFAFGKGNSSNGFIGSSDFALVDFLDDETGYHKFLFQWAFAAATTTIVSGSLAERCTFQAYILYSMFLSGFVYPVVAHWVWSSEGWLTAYQENPDDLLFDSGMIDFAGSAVVHMVGGVSGLVGAVVIGPRSGRFDLEGKPSPYFRGHSLTLIALGTFILWLGWYGFNPGSLGAINGSKKLEIVSRSAVTTTLSAAGGGTTALMITKVKNGFWDLAGTCNGILCGCVAATAGCAVIEPVAALFGGIISAGIFELVCRLYLRFQIDDPLGASPMHGFCGMWGVIYVGLVAKEQYVKQVYGETHEKYGAFYGGGGELLACQIIGSFTIAAWALCLLGPFFFTMNAVNQLRVPREEELMGLDLSVHGGLNYQTEPQAVKQMSFQNNKL